MITEIVNGEPRQVFDFSKPDITILFHGPVRIGAGYRRQIELAKSGTLIADPKWTNLAISMLKNRKKPHGMSDDDWREQLEIELKETILSNVNAEDLGGRPDEDLIILETLLTPATEMSVAKWYKEYAEDSEVQAVINFSKGIVESKIKIVSSTISSGGVTKKRKRVAR